MSYARTNIFLVSGDTTIVRPEAAKPETSLVFPASRTDFGWADEIKWVVSVESVTGAPTAWTLAVKFEYAVINHGGGRTEEASWFELDASNISTNIIEGAGFANFTQADTLPKAQKRSQVHFGQWARIRLVPTFTGGTNPGLRVNVIAELKGDM